MKIKIHAISNQMIKWMKSGAIVVLILLSTFMSRIYAQMPKKKCHESTEKPNILLVISDQLNWDYISAMGNSYVKTPNIDRLCRTGVRFDRAYAINPVSIPSRVSMFTAARPSKFGVFVPDEIEAEHTNIVPYVREKKIAFHLQQQGYKTYYGGKTHFRFSPKDMGFEIYAGSEEYRGVDCVPKAIAKLKKHAADHSDQPFFMVASLMNPHDICYAHIKDNRFDMEQILERTDGEGWKAKLRVSVLENLKIPEGEPGAGGYEPIDYYLRQAPPLPDNYMPQENEPSIISGIGEEKGMASAFGRYRGQYDETDWLLHRYAYCRFVEDFDRELGMLLDGLEASGMAENTFIIFTSDHGESLGSHQMAGKGFFFDEVCHVPFIISHHSIDGGRVDSVNLICNGLDLIPSVFELAGAGADPTWEGKSIIPLLHDANHKLDRDIIPVEFVSGMGIITHNFYYGIYTSGKANNEQLYDIRKRPLQMENDALDPAYSKVLDDHRHHFKTAHRETLVRYGHPEVFMRYLNDKQ